MYVIKKIKKVIKKFRFNNLNKIVGKMNSKKRIVFEKIKENLFVNKW